MDRRRQDAAGSQAPHRCGTKAVWVCLSHRPACIARAPSALARAQFRLLAAGCALVLLAHSSLPIARPPAVWFMGLASGAVAMASCTINDYFDADIDAVNDPQKPVGLGTCLGNLQCSESARLLDLNLGSSAGCRLVEGCRGLPRGGQNTMPNKRRVVGALPGAEAAFYAPTRRRCPLASFPATAPCWWPRCSTLACWHWRAWCPMRVRCLRAIPCGCNLSLTPSAACGVQQQRQEVQLRDPHAPPQPTPVCPCLASTQVCGS